MGGHMKIAFFDAKDYEIPWFTREGDKNGIEFKFFETKLCEDTAELARGFDGVCVFVNDEVNAAVVEKLYGFGIRVVALRCAGYNNVALEHCFGKIHVFRVPAYSQNIRPRCCSRRLGGSIRRTTARRTLISR